MIAIQMPHVLGALHLVRSSEDLPAKWIANSSQYPLVGCTESRHAGLFCFQQPGVQIIFLGL